MHLTHQIISLFNIIRFVPLCIFALLFITYFIQRFRVELKLEWWAEDDIERFYVSGWQYVKTWFAATVMACAVIAFYWSIVAG